MRPKEARSTRRQGDAATRVAAKEGTGNDGGRGVEKARATMAEVKTGVGNDSGRSVKEMGAMMDVAARRCGQQHQTWKQGGAMMMVAANRGVSNGSGCGQRIRGNDGRHGIEETQQHW